MLKKILFTVMAIAAVVVLVGYIFPQKVHVEVAHTFKADKTLVYDQIHDFKNWNNWSPWYQIDPNAKYEFSDRSIGAGAWMKWESDNKNIGNGQIDIIEESLGHDLVFEISMPEFDTKDRGEFILHEDAEGITVVWSMESDFGMNPIRRIIGSMMVEPQLEKSFTDGLNNIESYLENQRAITEVSK
ncbi:SRPBCC family protein [Sediminitomix flava]|uniref:Polyketide cyclase/dehydrase/lipid transport protein n=1 Tax=Sediminitomix flava TaxID=379075 RepID=A0A315ZEX5_SEDFL|nr:SRPBCC family protein [Sediminitomix flava]PWJ43284.1 polyketide cyclase/dehydrase/lipid transport protein [Sediminitomix flava]